LRMKVSAETIHYRNFLNALDALVVFGTANSLDGYAGFGMSVIRETQVKIRKVRRCWGCGERHEKGDSMSCSVSADMRQVVQYLLV